MYKRFVLSCFFAMSIAAAHATDWMEGLPSKHAVVKTESTGEIMAKGCLLEKPPFVKPLLKHTFRVGDVGFTKQARFPDSETVNIQDENAFSLPAVTPTPKTTTVQLNFLTVTFPESGYVPPDSMGAVGKNQYITVVNGRIRSFDKATGLQDGILDTTLDSFFAPVLSPNSSTTDPRIRYDKQTDRWFVICVDINLSTQSNNRVLLAVSAGGSVCNNQQWNFFYFYPAISQPASTVANYFADFPTLGIDNYALYIGVNVFDSAGNYHTSDGFVVNKASVLGSGPMIVYSFRNLVNPSTFSGPYSPQGVDVFDTNSVEGYFCGADAQFYGLLQLRRVLNPGGVPSISSNIPISVPSYTDPIPVPHKGNNAGPAGYLDAIDIRLGNCHVRNGVLYTIHNIGVNNVGVSDPSGTSTRNGSRYYQISLSNPASPVLQQSGTLYTYSTTNDFNQRSYWIPSLMTNGVGTILMGCSTAGVNEYINACFAFHFASDGPGLVRIPRLYTNSQTAYNLNIGGSPRRWGDYSNVSLDPTDNTSFWCIQEYCSATNQWGVRVAKVLVTPPTTVAAMSETVLPKYKKNLTLTIFGDVLGKGSYYDPGEDFDERLKVEFTGGVEVEKIESVSPKEITLLVSTEYAHEGLVDVKITNPDGQSVTSSGLLRVENL